jgi:hypothetical protein
LSGSADDGQNGTNLRKARADDPAERGADSAYLEGRFALDIMRGVLQTAVAARAPLQEYILSVLRDPPAEVAATPTRFTPREWMAANTQPSPGG